MIPVYSVTEARASDERAQKTIAMSTLIDRAGFAVGQQAISMLDAAYGKRVTVVAGKGHNGDDGRMAARVLRHRGAFVVVRDAKVSGPIAPCDLVIDAAFGTGFHGKYRFPSVDPSTPVLSVDVPSGLNADTGIATPGSARADVTLTFGRVKTGMFFHDGPDRCGQVFVADIGLPDVDHACSLVSDADIALLPRRRREGHKWDAAVFVVAGSPGMLGAASMVSHAALRSGSGMVRLGSPGAKLREPLVLEAVSVAIPAKGFASDVLMESEKCKAMVIGPGIGTDQATTTAVLEILSKTTLPTVVDADGLNALAAQRGWRDWAKETNATLVLTPHEGEFARLTGEAPGEDRLSATRSLAAACGAVVLLKGAPTVIAAPDGEVAIVSSGTTQLSTAGSGDVLSGVIGAFLARGLDPFRAAAIGAHVHGRAARHGHHEGLVASDLPDLIAEVLEAGSR